MYKIKNYFYFLCLGIFALSSACKQDGLSEEELQNLAQNSSLTVNAIEVVTQRPVEGVTVTVVSTGITLEGITDEYGKAYFEDVNQGDVIIRMNKEGYFEVKQQMNVGTSGRSTSDNVSLSLYNEEEAATIKGQLKIQTDLTTEAPEYAESIDINIFAGNNLVATGITDNEGRFEILVPTSENGRSFSIVFPDIERDQSLYVIEDSVPVLKTAVGTIFKPYEAAQKLPNTSNIIIEISEPYYSDGRQAYVESFELDSTITDITFGDIGYGYRFNPTVIVIVDGIENATEIELVNEYNTSNACSTVEYYKIDPNSLNIEDGGSDYPEYRSNFNISTQHPSRFYWNRCSRYDQGFTIRTGETIELDLNYGSGTITGAIQ